MHSNMSVQKVNTMYIILLNESQIYQYIRTHTREGDNLLKLGIHDRLAKVSEVTQAAKLT